MIKDGRPYTNENGSEDIALVTSLPYEDMRKVDEWIRQNIRHRTRELEGRTSYGLKHDLERDTGIYLTNNAFKDAMLLAGFKPIDPNELNWRYRISLAKERKAIIGPFEEWCHREELDKVNGSKGDFANDMFGDMNFPIFAEHDIILSYLENNGAVSAAIDTFEELWKDFDLYRKNN